MSEQQEFKPDDFLNQEQWARVAALKVAREMLASRGPLTGNGVLPEHRNQFDLIVLADYVIDGSGLAHDEPRVGPTPLTDDDLDESAHRVADAVFKVLNTSTSAAMNGIAGAISNTPSAWKAAVGTALQNLAVEDGLYERPES